MVRGGSVGLNHIELMSSSFAGVVPCVLFSSDMFRRVEPPWCVSGGCALVLDGLTASSHYKGILCVLLRILCLFSREFESEWFYMFCVCFLESSSLCGFTYFLFVF